VHEPLHVEGRSEEKNMSEITMPVQMYRIVTKEVFPLMNAPLKAKVLFKVVLPSWRVACA